MSSFSVSWEALFNEGDVLISVSRKLGVQEDRLEKVKSNLSGIDGFTKVNKLIDTVCNDLEDCRKNIKLLGKNTRKIALAYKLTEYSISGETGLEWSDLWNFVSSAGVAGQYGAMVGNMFSGDYGSAIGNGLLAFGGLAENAFEDNPKKWYEVLFGTYEDGMVANISKNGAKTIWGEACDGYKFSKSNTVGKNLNVGAQWAAAAIGNGFENYEEFGTVKNTRFWGETAVETGVDVAMGIGATMAVAAGAAAAGIAAPAVAVAAVGGGLVWGVNKAVEHFTGKDVGEWAADAVCDGAEWVKDKAGNAITSTKNSVCAWVAAIS